MDMLSQLRQDSEAFLASAVLPAEDDLPVGVAELPWWVEPASPDDLAADQARAVAGQPAPPAATPAPCPTCADENGIGGSAYFWQDLAGEVHCVYCTPIPTRRMLKELWQVLWLPPEDWRGERGSPRHAAWAAWRPQFWNPFAHLEAREQSLTQGSDTDGF